MNGLDVNVFVPRAGVAIHVQARCTRFPLVVLGPSGAGKTTLLECLAGLARPANGRIVWGDEVFFDAARGIHMAPETRRLGYVMQDSALFPHLTVQENVLFGVRQKRSRPAALQLLDELGIGALAPRRPQEISGGERARAALARALATAPQLLLLDEPFAALDPATRQATQRLLLQQLRERGLPAVVVTHDRSEALWMGRWTWLLLEGRVVQEGPPEDILRRPVSAAVARFVGTENFLAGVVEAREGDVCRVRCEGRDFHVLGTCGPGTPVLLCVRPEALLLSAAALPASSARNVFPARVVGVEAEGQLRAVRLEAGVELRALITPQAEEELGLCAGATVVASFKAAAAHLLARSPRS